MIDDSAGQGNETTVSLDVDALALTPGRTIGRYVVVSVLGQGGFGITYRARDLRLGREVAIKEYLPSAIAYRVGGATVRARSTGIDGDFAAGRERFVAEGRTLATLDHAPGIVRVFDFIEANNTAYIVMELIQGETLGARVTRDGPFGAAFTARILAPLLDGLEQVHAAGFLHRDIKPANILINARGEPTLIDFGAARAAIADRSRSLTAVFTPGYAAPEQMTSAAQGPWTDIYALSATLYFAITGKAPPYSFDRMLDDSLVPLRQLRPSGFTPALLRGLDAGLAVRAGDRPQSIRRWRPMLGIGGTMSVDNDVTAAMPMAVGTAPSRARRVGLGAAVAAVLLLGGGYAAFGPGEPSHPAAVDASDAQRADPVQAAAEQRAKQQAEEAQRRTTEAQRKAEQEAANRRRLEDEARRAAETKAPPPGVPTPGAAAAVAGAFDGNYAGSYTASAGATNWSGASGIRSVSIRIDGAAGSGTITQSSCGSLPVSIRVLPSGDVFGDAAHFDASCGRVQASFTGRIADGVLRFTVVAPGSRGSGILRRGAAAPVTTVAPSQLGAVAGALDGTYSGALAISNPGYGSSVEQVELRLVGGRGTGTVSNPNCGNSPVNLTVAPSGAVTGTLTYTFLSLCNAHGGTITGTVQGSKLVLEMTGTTTAMRGRMTLARTGD